MVSIVPNQELRIIARLASAVSGTNPTISSGASDNATGTTLAAHTKLNDITSTSVNAKAFDATFPSEAAVSNTSVVTHQWTHGSSDANFAIGRFTLHTTAFGSVTVSSTGLAAAVDGFSFTKTSAITSFIVQVKLTFSSL